jgi:hypothetical protein
MDCNDDRLLLAFARPLTPELEESEAEALADHLSHCLECAALEQRERRLDEPIARAMRAIPVPPGLRDRLIDRLASERTVKRRRMVLRWAAAAACLVLAFGGAWYQWGPQPAIVDLAALHSEANDQPDTPAKVEEWFRARGFKSMAAPASFDYVCLVNCLVADFHGKPVPLLEFRRDRDTAWVYVLDEQRFDLAALEAQSGHSGGSYFVEWQRDPVHPHVAFVIIYTGGLEQFKKRAQAT